MLKTLSENLDKILDDIEANVIPDNIVENKTILGITGTAIKLKGENLEINPTKYRQTLIPSNGKNAFTFIKVLPVTSNIDTNINSNNIKSGVSILGVNGNLSNLTKEDYDEALYLLIDILGKLIYVHKNILTIKNENVNITDDTIHINGIVENNVLKII